VFISLANNTFIHRHYISFFFSKLVPSSKGMCGRQVEVDAPPHHVLLNPD